MYPSQDVRGAKLPFPQSLGLWRLFLCVPRALNGFLGTRINFRAELESQPRGGRSFIPPSTTDFSPCTSDNSPLILETCQSLFKLSLPRANVNWDLHSDCWSSSVTSKMRLSAALRGWQKNKPVYSLARRGGLSFTSVRARWKSASELRADPPEKAKG